MWLDSMLLANSKHLVFLIALIFFGSRGNVSPFAMYTLGHNNPTILLFVFGNANRPPCVLLFIDTRLPTV